MQLAFALFHYFPYGGLERDMLAVARACQARGHTITIFTGDWQGDKPADMAIVELPTQGLSNHARAKMFVARLHERLCGLPHATVIGFNKMPGLDVYYAADTCFAAKAFEERNFFYRLTARARQFLALENAVFERSSNTEILMIAKAQIAVYQRRYQTPNERLHLLPPGIRRECVMPADYTAQRERIRAQFSLTADTLQILLVGSDYQRKGLDRALRGIAALDESLRQRVRLWVAGQDKAAPFINLARTLNIESQISFLGARDDIPQLMWGADLLIHPAYSEAAGLVLLEAMVAGLPVIASRVCGHAHYITDYTMGAELNDPITPDEVADAITSVLTQPRETWRERSRTMAATADIFSMPERAADIIEATAKANGRHNA
jgi:UDP-glucose:(heptosyl)LPS alpha-1,3-glucosyltransferase